MSQKRLVVPNWVARNEDELVATLHDMHEGRYQTSLPATVQFISDGERDRSLEAIKKGKTHYQKDSFDYQVNKMGFRGDWDFQQTRLYTNPTIAVFGCSYTFGEGLPANVLWHKVLGDRLSHNFGQGFSIFNFGVSSASASKIARLMNLVLDFAEFDAIYVLLPQLGRTEVVETFETPRMYFHDLVPSYTMPHAKTLSERYYKFASEDYLDYEFMKNVAAISSLGRAHRTPLMMSSWDKFTHQLLLQVPRIQLGPWFGQAKDQIYMDCSDTARDGLHAGPTAHRYFGEQVAELMAPLWHHLLDRDSYA